MWWPFPRRSVPIALAATAVPRRTSVDLSDLNRRARKAVIEQWRQARTADLARGTPITMRPRSEVVADIVARRASTKGA